jgi:hypothetical protein
VCAAAAQFKAGLRHGRGAITLRDGGEYDGGWQQGRMHGAGAYTWPDLSRYEGEWRDGLRHGTGTHTLATGARSGGWTSACCR